MGNVHICVETLLNIVFSEEAISFHKVITHLLQAFLCLTHLLLDPLVESVLLQELATWLDHGGSRLACQIKEVNETLQVAAF